MKPWRLAGVLREKLPVAAFEFQTVFIARNPNFMGRHCPSAGNAASQVGKREEIALLLIYSNGRKNKDHCAS